MSALLTHRAGLRAHRGRTSMKRFLSSSLSALLFLFLPAVSLYAQQGGGSLISPAGIERPSFLNIILQGGTVMMSILAVISFIAVLLIMFYFLTIRKGTVVSNKFMNSADALIRKQDYLGLIAVCNRQNEAIARVTYKTLDFATKNPTANLEDVREVAEAEGSRQASILNGRISYLADIGAIAPMVGLLGTVFGMITAFRNIGVGAQQMELGSGVSQALITTAGGLVIGIPALIFYSLFRGKVQKLIAELEAATTHLMALLGAQYKRSMTRPAVDERPSPFDVQSRHHPQHHDDYESIGADYPLGRSRQDPKGL